MASSPDGSVKAAELYTTARRLYRDGKSEAAIDMYTAAADAILCLWRPSAIYGTPEGSSCDLERLSNLIQIATELRICGDNAAAVSVLDKIAPHIASPNPSGVDINTRIHGLTLLLCCQCELADHDTEQNVQAVLRQLHSLVPLVTLIQPNRLENEDWVVNTLWTALYFLGGCKDLHIQFIVLEEVLKVSWVMQRHSHIWEKFEAGHVMRQPPFYKPGKHEVNADKNSDLWRKQAGLTGYNTSPTAEDIKQWEKDLTKRLDVASQKLSQQNLHDNTQSPALMPTLIDESGLWNGVAASLQSLNGPKNSSVGHQPRTATKSRIVPPGSSYTFEDLPALVKKSFPSKGSPGVAEALRNAQRPSPTTQPRSTVESRKPPLRIPHAIPQALESTWNPNKLRKGATGTAQASSKPEPVLAPSTSKPDGQSYSYRMVSNSQTEERRSTFREPQILPLRQSNKIYGRIFSGPSEAARREHLADRWFKRDLESRCHPILRDPAYATTDGSAHNRIKVAVLDTGIAKSKASGRPELVGDYLERIKDCVTFEGDADGKPDLSDQDGHGTHVAMLVLKTFPNADLYIAKVASHADHIKKESVNKALRWAIDSNVDIINMSFGWEQVDIGDMADLLDEADGKRILLFAATSNDGLHKVGGMAYPAISDKVIGMDCASGAGVSTQELNPPSNSRNNAKGLRFTAPGERVESAYPTHLAPSGLTRLDGTSFASPIAAGIAAMVLDFAQQEPLSYEPAIFRALKRREIMLWVFHDLLTEKIEDLFPFRFLLPWKLWEAGKRPDGSYICGHAKEAGGPRRVAAEKIVECLRSRNPAFGSIFYGELNRR